MRTSPTGPAAAVRRTNVWFWTNRVRWGHCRVQHAAVENHISRFKYNYLLANIYNVLPQCHASVCVSNAPCIGSQELSYHGSCWPWESEEPCEPPEVLISDIYGNVSCACKCVDIENGSCHQCLDDDVPRRTFDNSETCGSPFCKDPVTIPTVTIPTVLYHQKYVRKILCSSDPLFCNIE